MVGASLIHSQVTESPSRTLRVAENTIGGGVRGVAEYTIGSKVVAYSRVRAVVNLVCPSARGLSQHPRVSRMLH